MRAKTAGVDRDTNTYGQSEIVEILLRAWNEARERSEGCEECEWGTSCCGRGYLLSRLKRMHKLIN